MRKFQHLSARYIIDRTREKLYARAHPEAPWLTPQATEILTTMLRPSDRGVEFGSGRSTMWLARRVQHLTSVEHDETWYTDVSRRLKEHGISNVDYVYAPRDLPDEGADASEYVTVALRFPEHSLQFALVDGVYRDHCAALTFPRLAPGGLLVIDNVNWYLPSRSRAPASRREAEGTASPVWARTRRTLQEWRTIWTTNGVWDTAIFIKP